MNKTKFFSSLLVAALFATTSVFTSCKDYDDDIKNLQSQIDKAALKADLDALTTKLATVESTANAGKSTAETALAKANANATDIAAVKKIAEDAGAAAADALTKVAKAQSTAEAAQAAADKAQAAADAAKAVADAAATKTYADEIKAAAEKAQAAADAAQTAANNAQAAADKAQATADKKADKTYADEIKGIADAAKALAEKAATKDELATAKNDLTKLVNAAQSTADAAKTLAEAAATKKELADAKKELQDYAKSVEDQAKAAAEAAAKAFTDAKKYTDDEVAKVNKALESYATNTAVETLSNKLDKEISDLNETLAGLTEADFKEVKVIVDNFNSILDAIFSMVTSVELIATYTGTINDDLYTYPMGSFIDEEFGNTISFIFGKQATDEKFGDKEDRYEDADPIIEYSKDADIKTQTALLVRVNPTNAVFTKDQVKFFDSKGNSLDEIVEVGDPVQYKGLITRTTRSASEQATGLWVVPVKVKENTAKDAFNEVTIANFEKWKKNAAPEYKLYAVAINNTTESENTADRFVASTYDLAAEYVDFVPATDLYFNIDGKNVGQYHNRWYNSKRDGVQGYIQSKDQYEAYTTKNPEQRWKKNAAGKPEDAETVNDANDYRYNNGYYVAEVGQTMTLELPANYKAKAEWWYVAFDYEMNAVESAPSEWEAWKSYESKIEGLHKMTAGVDKIKLTVNAEAAQGDVIGFRVFAVNYDGTLLDPDGKAFYVKCGEIPTITVTANGIFNALQQSATAADGKNSGIAKIEYQKDEEGNEIRFESMPLSVNSGTKYLYPGNNDSKLRNYVAIQWYLYKDKDGKTLATDWKDINYIKLVVDGAYLNDILDGTTLDLGELTSRLISDANNRQKYVVKGTATKVMPTEGKDGITWKDGYEYAETIYVIPEKQSYLNVTYDKNTKEFYWNGGNALRNSTTLTGQNLNDQANWVAPAAKTGARQIKDYIVSGSIINNVDYQHKFVFNGLPTGNKDHATDAYATTPDDGATALRAGNTVVDVLPAAINGKGENKSYNYTLFYVYKNISATNYKDKNGNVIWNTGEGDFDYPVEVWTKPTKFEDALYLLSYSYKNTYYVYEGYNRVEKTSAQLFIYWSDIVEGNASVLRQLTARQSGFGPYASWVEDYYQMNSDLVNFLRADDNMTESNKVLADDAGLTWSEFIPQRYTFGKSGKIDLKISGNITTYLKLVDGSTTDNLQVQRLQGSAQPYENKEGIITLTGVDVFGKTHTWDIVLTMFFDK